jgi:hypothetical protein
MVRVRSAGAESFRGTVSLMEKRRREQLRKQKRQDKEQRRVQRVAERQKRELEGGKDSDLEGMVPGPQPGQIIDQS